QPVKRFFRFQSLWPWRTSTRRRSLITVSIRRVDSVAKPQHVGHGVEAGLLAMRPQRRLDRPMGEDRAIFGVMRQRQSLGGTAEDQAVIARRRAAAQRCKADVTGSARTGMAVAAARRMVCKLDAAAIGGGFTKHESSAGGSIDLGAVMHLDDFDIKALVER